MQGPPTVTRRILKTAQTLSYAKSLTSTWTTKMRLSKTSTPVYFLPCLVAKMNTFVVKVFTSLAKAGGNIAWELIKFPGAVRIYIVDVADALMDENADEDLDEKDAPFEDEHVDMHIGVLDGENYDEYTEDTIEANCNKVAR